MTFPHEDPEFRALIEIVAADGPIRSSAMVEKDYWLCHALWGLERSGRDFWFKGGTSLSKAFGILPRFSEDLDLVVRERKDWRLPGPGIWKREDAGPSRRRREFWEELCQRLELPGATVALDQDHDPTFRNVGVQVTYPGHFIEDLRSAGSVIRPYVLLEMSHASVARSARAPAVTRAISSAVHDRLEELGQLSNYEDNRPQRIECAHPYLTLIEKLDAITRRYEREDNHFDPASFARHYEDAARIIREEASLAPIAGTPGELAREMLKKAQIRQLSEADHPAFALPDPERRAEVERAYQAIGPMYWAPRIEFDTAVEEIRTWLREQDFAAPAGAVV